MKIICNVEINYRLSYDSRRRKAQKSCLSIGKMSSNDNDLYIVLQTLQSKQGSKYKVKDNIEVVFTKFIDEGKMTIRFKEPPHDLLVQGDAIQLKSFAHTLKLGFSNKLNASVLSLVDIKTRKILTTGKSKITIRSTVNYPILEGFPRTTTELNLVGLERKSFDRAILKLQNLRILDLSHNQISSLPKDLGMLPNLQELRLAHNSLSKSPKSKWTWMDGIHIIRNLKLLDLSFNQIEELPEQIGKMSSLLTLKLNSNSLKHLPQSLGCMESLKILDVSKNQLLVLPGSIQNLRLSTLNVADNSFVTSDKCIIKVNLKLPTLIDCAARVVLKSRMYYNESNIPSSLVSYLNTTQFCACGDPCFDNYIRKPIMITPSRFAISIIFSGFSTIPLDCFFCSFKCNKSFSR